MCLPSLTATIIQTKFFVNLEWKFRKEKRKKKMNRIPKIIKSELLFEEDFWKGGF